MESRISKNNNGYIDYTGKPIIVYKRKSGGVIMGEFNCLTEFALLESKHRHPTVIRQGSGIALGVRTSIYRILDGSNKSMKSYHFNCDITIKFKKAI